LDENDMPNMRPKRRQCQKEWQVRNYKRAPRWLPPKDDPRGISRAIMKKLSQSGLSNDPQAFNLKLQQLLKEAENGSLR